MRYTDLSAALDRWLLSLNRPTFVALLLLLLLTPTLVAQTVQHVTIDKAASCAVAWSQGASSLAAAQAATAMTKTDAGAFVPAVGYSCSGTASPYACQVTLPVAAQTLGSHSVTVSLTDAFGQVTINEALAISVDPVNTAPTIVAQPSSVTVAAGQTATFSVTANGTPAPTFQWYQGASGDTSTPIAGATGASYTTAALSSSTTVWVRATNSAGSADSVAVTATVNLPAPLPKGTNFRLILIGIIGGIAAAIVAALAHHG